MTRSRPLTLLAAAAVSSVIALVLAGLAVVGAGCGSTQPASGVSAVPLASTSATSSLEQQFVGVVKAVSPSVVTRSVVTLASADSHPATVVGTDRAGPGAHPLHGRTTASGHVRRLVEAPGHALVGHPDERRGQPR